MKTFIVLTFGFLGFAFYQLSGGSDFEPASARLAQADAQAPHPEATPEPAQAASTAAVSNIAPAEEVAAPAPARTPDDSTSEVTRVALNLAALTAPAALTVQPASPDTAPVARIIDSSETPRIILPSLIATTPSDPVISDTATGDIRTVSANRVNVRGGPSTNYGVVSSLSRGEAVRVLDDNGAGWVLMEPLEGGTSGWMADFLLTAG